MSRGRWIAVAAAFAVALAIYVYSLPGQVSSGDTAEAQTVPYILGIAHATGFPAYTLAGWLFSHAFAFGSVAWRLNLFAAICTALTASGVVLLALALEANVFAAMAAALVFAAGSTIWHGAVYASPHPLAGLLTVIALAACVVYARNGAQRALYTACLCVGLGLATHPIALWALPAIAVAALFQRRTLRPRTVALALGLLIAPLFLYGYFPIRSSMVAAQHLDPAAAPPVDGTGRLDWDINSPRTLSGFLDEVLARHEHALASLSRTFSARVSLGSGGFWLTRVREQFSVWLLGLAALGIIALARSDRRSLCVVIAGVLGGIWFAYFYRSDLSIDRYFLVSIAATAALAAAATRLTLRRMRGAYWSAAVTLVLTLAVAGALFSQRLLPAILRYSPNQTVIDAAAHDIPDGAIVVAPWADATALGYGAYVEHALGTRIVLAGWPLEFQQHYDRWAQTRRLVIFANVKDARLLRVVPKGWLRELPSTLPQYRRFEYLPERARLGEVHDLTHARQK